MSYWMISLNCQIQLRRVNRMILQQTKTTLTVFICWNYSFHISSPIKMVYTAEKILTTCWYVLTYSLLIELQSIIIHYRINGLMWAAKTFVSIFPNSFGCIPTKTNKIQFSNIPPSVPSKSAKIAISHFKFWYHYVSVVFDNCKLTLGVQGNKMGFAKLHTFSFLCGNGYAVHEILLELTSFPYHASETWTIVYNVMRFHERFIAMKRPMINNLWGLISSDQV